MYPSLSFVPVGHKLAIPQLPPCPNRKEVREYLEWLAASEFCYHLDDAASECGFPKEAGRILEENADAMFSQFDDAHIWAIYWPLACGEENPLAGPNGRDV